MAVILISQEITVFNSVVFEWTKNSLEMEFPQPALYNQRSKLFFQQDNQKTVDQPLPEQDTFLSFFLPNQINNDIRMTK